MTTSFRQVTASEAEDRAGPGLRYGRASPGPGPILHGRFSTTPLDVTTRKRFLQIIAERLRRQKASTIHFLNIRLRVRDER